MFQFIVLCFNYDDLQVRLLYERVSKQKRPIMAHLDDPVIVYIPLIRLIMVIMMAKMEMVMMLIMVVMNIISIFHLFLRRAQSYSLAELPMGKTSQECETALTSQY